MLVVVRETGEKGYTLHALEMKFTHQSLTSTLQQVRSVSDMVAEVGSWVFRRQGKARAFM
ncbi:hypothetical protein ES288_A05G230300v1 [Gossypium darwinii]|uniref:Uncharacterized protein n=1 Tax=Gossypium darwinii TaxID=34276 RepID=A0A5D2GIP5_GOSDA|nr:hypothetical protein ES288_A05G230300v1 [Gossypium darwinii]